MLDAMNSTRKAAPKAAGISAGTGAQSARGASLASTLASGVKPLDDQGRELWSGDYYGEGVVNDHDFFFDKLREECGVFGVFGHPEAAHLAYYGLHALQHRGQESAGICVSDGSGFHYHRDMGLVKEIFDTEIMSGLQGAMGIAHVRYATSDDNRVANAQPLIFKYREGDLAIATNGSLVNAVELREKLERTGSIFQTTSDTEVLAHLIARSQYDEIVDALRDALSQVDGAYSFLIQTRTKLIAVRDPHGFRPFVLGKLGDAYIFASETCAFDAVGAEYVRDIEPGEMLILELGKSELRTERIAPVQRQAVCAMEYIYFARPDSDIDEVNIHAARKRLGRRLAMEAFIDADVVTGVPDSSISAAIGYAEQTGIPYELGLIKNRYIGRTFIEPSQALREQGVKMKLSAVRKVVEGKRVVMIDDSIVRGTTSLRIVNLLREAGATEVHVRISSPPFQNPCFYGIDTPTRQDLIAAQKSVEEIRQAINADSLHFLSHRGLLEAIDRGAADVYNRGLCTACFDNRYPTKLYQHTVETAEAANSTLQKPMTLEVSMEKSDYVQA